MRRVFLDHNATSPLEPAAREAMLALLDAPCNASSVHQEGQRARAAVELARRELARLIGARSGSDLTFTSGATEANNLALHTLAHLTQGALLSSRVEHPSVLAPLARLEAQGRRVIHAGVDERGRLPSAQALAELAQAEGVGAISLMLANNETGNLLDWTSLARAAKAQGCWLHCDATQAVGRVPVDVAALGVDLLTFSSHKLGGPPGVGALWVKPGVELCPLIVGGHQERGKRGGTENAPALAGFGAAAKLARERLPDAAPRVAALRDWLWTRLQAMAPDAVRQGDPDACLPNTLNVRFPGVDGETLLINLDLEGVAASAGAACSAGSLEPSHVLLAMGVPKDLARSSLRLSLGAHTTQEDLDLALPRLARALAQSRRA